MSKGIGNSKKRKAKEPKAKGSLRRVNNLIAKPRESMKKRKKSNNARKA
jgi:hypothetical protein